MNELHLVIVDTARIQPYIFGSNRLRENIGASYLVSQVTGEWAFEEVQKAAPQNNIDTIQNEFWLNTRQVETDLVLQAEVIYSGGGNFVVLFREVQHAQDFIRNLSRRALIHAPGLQLVIVREQFTLGQTLLKDVIQETFSKLELKKRSRKITSPLMGLGVTEACHSTGMPATGLTERIANDPTSVYPASAEVLAKLKMVSQANTRLTDMFGNVLGSLADRLDIDPGQCLFPMEFENLGRSQEEFSYIAVIHADGNGLGQRILDLGKTVQDDRQYIRIMRDFSQKIDRASRSALDNTLLKLVDTVDTSNQTITSLNADGEEISTLHLKRNKPGKNEWFLPVRPIVYGGDDITLLCDGRLGLSIALEFLQQIESETAKVQLPDRKGPATACAGISIVKSHYPFAQAYELAEDLAQSAKHYRREMGINGACLDWHIGLSGLFGNILAIRNREYQTGEGSLTLRPVTTGQNLGEPLRAWPVVEKGMMAFRGRDWSTRHNKVKALRDVLRAGPDEVNAFLTKFNHSEPLPVIHTAFADIRNNGWHEQTCGYFDAIEMVDWFIPLSQEIYGGNS